VHLRARDFSPDRDPICGLPPWRQGFLGYLLVTVWLSVPIPRPSSCKQARMSTIAVVVPVCASRRVATVSAALLALAITGCAGSTQSPNPATSTASATRAPAWSPGVQIGAQENTVISCPTATFCMAVGAGVAYTLSATGWSSGSVLPLAQGDRVAALSCATSTNCMAVSADGDAFAYSAGVWSAGASIGNVGTRLTDVSCPTASFCVAVDSGGSEYTYDDSTWSGGNTLDSSGVDPLFTSVSCATPNFCVALDGDGNEYMDLNGTWSSGMHLIAAASGVSVAKTLNSSVSCPTPTFCQAIDFWGDEYTWADGTWKADDVTAPAHGMGDTGNFACPAANVCVGLDFIAGRAFTYAGGRWSKGMQIDIRGSGDTLGGISCATATSCVAVDTDGYAYRYSNV
jgi:hypothetical protein